MKRMLSLLICVISMFIFMGIGVAEEKTTRDECAAKCKEAVALINSIDIEASAAKINDPKEPFVWKDSYIFIADLQGITEVHFTPALIGKNIAGCKDVDGKIFWC